MILPTMTYTEIAKELDKDHQALYAYADRAVENKKYYKIGMKHSEPVRFKPIEWTSSRKNKYIILPHTNGKSFMKKYGMCFTIFCYYYGEKNYLNAVILNRNCDYCFFCGHVFERYAERFLMDTSMNKLEKMIEYTKNNWNMAGTAFESAIKYEDGIFCRVKDGIVLGSWEGGYQVYRTFITEEMLKGEEIGYNDTTLKNWDIGMKECLNSPAVLNKIQAKEAQYNKRWLLPMAS